MEDSRRGKGNREKELPTSDPHVDGGNGVKTIVYNTKKNKKKRKKKTEKEGGRKRKRKKRAKG